MENQKNSTKILWVDDDINTLFLKLHLDDLQDDGFTVLRAENPDEVESLLQENKDIKMIITDNSMPT
jgi:CheY-like chemotaxis protein